MSEWRPPGGFIVVETRDRVTGVEPRRFLTQRGAFRESRRYAPNLPSYHLKVERWGFLDWRAVPYQNVLRKLCPECGHLIPGPHKEGCSLADG